MNTDKTQDIIPHGVTLRRFDDVPATRQAIFDKTQEAVSTVFPQSYGGVRLEVDYLEWADPETYDLQRERKAFDQGEALGRRLRGKLTLRDEATGEVLDSDTRTIIRAPYMTERGGFLHNGSEYFVPTQSRLLPGVYMRRRDTGEVEAQVNPRQGTGSAFRIQLEPETGVLRLNMRKSNIKLYSLLRDLGYSDEDLKSRWGERLWQANKDAYDPKVFARAYGRLLRNADASADPEERKQALIDMFSNLKVNRESAQVTLPQLISRMKSAATQRSGFKDYGASDDDVPMGTDGLLDVVDRLLRVARGEEEPDERDSPVFKRYIPVDEQLKERLLLDSGKLRLNTMRQLSRSRSLKPFRPGHFDQYVNQLVVKNTISSPAEEINPLHILEQQRRFTAMGEGGIQSSESITPEAQNINPAQFGFIGISEGPESERAGVDARFSYGAQLGSDGKVYQRFRDTKTGKHAWLSPSDLHGKVVQLPQ